MNYRDAISVLFTIAIIVLYFVMADKKKHKYPRTILFINWSLAFGLGLLILTFTYSDFTHGQVNPLFFKGPTPTSRHLENDSTPIIFTIGLIFNILVGLAFALAGLFGMFKAVTNTKFRFKE